MSKTLTFVAKSGNVALLEIKTAGDRRAVDVTWDHSPSKKDIRQCNEFYASQDPEAVAILSAVVEDDRARKALIDEMLYGGQKN